MHHFNCPFTIGDTLHKAGVCFVVTFDMESRVGVESRGDGANDGEEERRTSADGSGSIVSWIQEWQMNIGVVEKSLEETTSATKNEK